MFEIIKTKLLTFKNLLLENKYLSKFNRKDVIETPPYNQKILIDGILNVYIKDLLLQEKNKIIAAYDEEIKTQKVLADNILQRHNKEHRDVMRNIEILLNNLQKINDAITALTFIDENIINKHIKEVLDLQDVNNIKLKKK